MPPIQKEVNNSYGGCTKYQLKTDAGYSKNSLIGCMQNAISYLINATLLPFNKYCALEQKEMYQLCNW
eukprot:8281185-Ditylum_brightwellii.AAC.1